MVDFERSIKEGSSDNRIIVIIGSCCWWWRRSLLWLILITIFTLLAVVGESFAAIVPYRRHRRTLSAFSSSSSSSFSSGSNHLVMKMTKTSQQDTQDFLQYAAAAVDLSSVHYIPEADAISVVRSVRDLDKEGRQKYLYHIPINRSGSNGSFKLPPTLMESTIQIRIPSPSGSKLMIVKQQDGGDSSSKKKKCIIEIWQGDALTRRIAIENNKQHGPIINDPTGFGIPTWSPDESCILYVAERKPITTKPFWEEKEEENDEINTTVNPTTAEKDDDVDNNKTPTTTIYGGQNILGQGTLEDWGEKLFNQSPILDLYILNIQTGKYQRVTNVPNPHRPQEEEEEDGGGITLGQAVWHPSGTSIAYTGWDAGGLGNMSRRLGMIFCRNRPSKIYVSDVSKLLKSLILTVEEEKEGNDNDKDDNEDKDFICITPDYVLSRSPQYVDMGGNDVSLVFLSNPKGFISHDGCMGLYQYKKKEDGSGGDDTSNVLDCIVRVVQVPDNNNNKQDKNAQPSLHGMGFPGLFLSQLPIDCGCGQQFVLVNTVWGSFQRIVRIDIKSGTVNLIDVDGLSDITSQSLLCKSSSSSSSSSDENADSWILSEVASNQPARIWNVHGLLSPANDSGIVHVKNPSLVFEFASITTTSFSSNKPNNFDIPIDLKVISIPPPDLVDNDDKIINGGDTNIQALVMIPRKTEKVPLIVIPHGGPHSGTISNYAPGFAFLASNYAVVFPNYRGSVGFGQTMLECLMTRIGKVDVEDVMACTKYVLEEEKDRIDTSRVGICGGSHGGFLTAHCTGQYPDFFKAAVVRNPVTNIASMVTATDIADWCYAVALGEYDSSKFRGPTLSEMTTMYEKSPIVHAGNVQTPTLVALGMVDLRVPPSQGKEWYHTLRSAGIDTQLLVYPEDSHALDKVTTEADHWINIKQWFDKYFR